MERGDQISRQQRRDGAMVTAARVAMNRPLAKDRGVRFINFPEGFIRPVEGDQAANPVRLPPGRIGGAILDRETGNAVALIRATDVSAGVLVHPSVNETPKERSAVYLDMALPNGKRGALEKFALANEDRVIPADEFVEAGSRVYAMWFDVAAGSATLIVRGANVRYDGPGLLLRPGKIATLRGELPPVG